MEPHRCMVPAWHKDISPVGSGQSLANGGQLIAGKTKLLSRLIGVEDTAIPLGINSCCQTPFLQVLYVCTSEAPETEDFLY